MRLTILLLFCAAGLIAADSKGVKPAKKETKHVKITAVLLVNEIEKSLPFWVDRMGFTKTVEVPEGNKLAFVILVRDGAELMMQTIASVEKDQPKLAPKPGSPPSTALFIEVNDFEDILKRLAGYPIAMAERTTFYGMREIGVFEPNGNMPRLRFRSRSNHIEDGRHRFYKAQL